MKIKVHISPDEAVLTAQFLDARGSLCEMTEYPKDWGGKSHTFLWFGVINENNSRVKSALICQQQAKLIVYCMHNFINGNAFNPFLVKDCKNRKKDDLIFACNGKNFLMTNLTQGTEMFVTKKMAKSLIRQLAHFGHRGGLFLEE